MLTLKKSHQPEIKSDFLTNLKDSWCYVLCLLLLPSVAMRETTRSEFSNRSQNLSKKSLEQTSITSARKQKAVKSIRKTQLQKQLWPRHPWFPTLSDWEKTSLEWIHLLKWDTKFHWNSQNFAQNAKCDIIGLFPFVTTKSNGKAGFARIRIHYVGKNGFSGKNPLSSDWQTFITTLEAA